MAGPNDDERDRVRGYLLAQGEKYSWLDLWPRVVAGRLEFLGAVADVNEEQAAFQPQSDAWTIAEVGHHVLQASRSVQSLIVPMALGEPGPERDTDPARAPAELPWDALQEALVEDSVAFAAVITDLPEPPSFEHLAQHPFFGELHARAWFLFQRVHDQDHARQVLANKEAAGYPAA